MIDRSALLIDLKPMVAALEEDIGRRAAEVPELKDHLQAGFDQAEAANRTAMSFDDWRDGEITQAAVAWVLGCIFVRFLEDNELIDRPLLSGPDERRAAASGAREEYFQAYPSHSDREYLEHAFRSVAGYPAVAPLYDDRHNPIWRLGLTGDGASELLALWTRIDPDSGALIHDFEDTGLDTRFLGDLYQDLSEAARKRYALLQTPEFVEEFILEHTLVPAIDEFGLETVRMIDPTCGSGHFLIGGFRRLFALWREREPGSSAGELAQRSLDAVYGVDLNPYATAIARFRLVIEALRECGVRRLADAPQLDLNLATGDSLLHGPERGQFPGMERRAGIEHVYETEDAPELKRILGQGYHAVVGNPPYINVKDAAMRNAYRARYDSCRGKYALSVPFMERFFELAALDQSDVHGAAEGYVGKITANSFMKREFGKLLVEDFLPTKDLSAIVDTSGAYIPGHGTPTLILFGRQRPPTSTTLRVLDGIRGEPGQPSDPSHGLVWTSVRTLIDRPGSEDRFIRASDVDRVDLSTHPLTLGIGRDVRQIIEREASTTLRASGAETSINVVTGADEAFEVGFSLGGRQSVPVERQTLLIDGHEIREWQCASSVLSILPYDGAGSPIDDGVHRRLWRVRALLEATLFFGKTKAERGLDWFEYAFRAADLARLPRRLAWGEVATHNHFVLDGGSKVFKQTAPIIKLPASATEEGHLLLLGVLNSSTACFWLKQVCHNKGSTVDDKGARQRTAPFEDFFQFNSTNVAELPLPAERPLDLTRALDEAASERAKLPSIAAGEGGDLGSVLRSQAEHDERLRGRMVSLQEELDWQVMAQFGLLTASDGPGRRDVPNISFGERAFEIALARKVASGETDTTWFTRHAATGTTELPPTWPEWYRALVERRLELIEHNAAVALLESPEYKRRWAGQGWEGRLRMALESFVLDSVEDGWLWRDGRLRSTGEVTDAIRTYPELVEACELLAESPDIRLVDTVTQLITGAAVPFLASYRLKRSGMRTRGRWEKTWDLQRRVDRTGTQEAIPPPPRYKKADFRSSVYWSLRGKLDVPKERFVIYPGAERGADSTPVVGWAGWNERDQARALATRIIDLRQQENAEAARLTPLLAGILEFLPWIEQWFPDPDPDYGGPAGEFFTDWLDGELSGLGLTRDELRAWRPS